MGEPAVADDPLAPREDQQERAEAPGLAEHGGAPLLAADQLRPLQEDAAGGHQHGAMGGLQREPAIGDHQTGAGIDEQRRAQLAGRLRADQQPPVLRQAGGDGRQIGGSPQQMDGRNALAVAAIDGPLGGGLEIAVAQAGQGVGGYQRDLEGAGFGHRHGACFGPPGGEIGQCGR